MLPIVYLSYFKSIGFTEYSTQISFQKFTDSFLTTYPYNIIESQVRTLNQNKPKRIIKLKETL